MILVNENSLEWFNNMSVFDLFKKMKYKLNKPSVLIKVNEEIIRSCNWDKFQIPDNSVITVVNLLRGG
jgi:thiamine biosynthesis protein ThiS